METREIIKKLCKNQGISVNKLETDLGFGTGYVSKLGKSTPNVKKIKSIADYFNVSVDYLMTGKENVFVESQAEIDFALARQNERVKEYMLKFAKLSDDKRNQIMSLIDMLEDK